MSIETIGTGLKARLQTISGLTAFAPNELPESINQFPTALILQDATQYDAAFSSADFDTRFRIIILFSKADQPTTLDKIIPYTEPTGTESVRAAINGDKTLGGAADSLIVQTNSGMGTTQWGKYTYISTEFEVLVYG